MAAPLAIVPCFNEADILPATLAHLRAEGCDVLVIDNWSSDASWLIAKRFGRCERFPAEGPSPHWDWTGMLQRVAAVGAEHKGWVLFHDADEIRRPPLEWPGFTLSSALAEVERQGFSAVHFAPFEFPPIDDGYTGQNPESYFRYYRVPRVDGRLPHVKAWLGGRQVDLAASGGHEAAFPGRRIFPVNFVLKHYPFRTSQQAERKLAERRARYAPAELAKQWHVQYQKIGRFELADPKGLSEWPPLSAR